MEQRCWTCDRLLNKMESAPGLPPESLDCTNCWEVQKRLAEYLSSGDRAIEFVTTALGYAKKQRGDG